MTTTTTNIQDGIYFLHPEGSGWIAAEFRGGKLRRQTEESCAATHHAAGDSWANIVPTEDDEEITGPEHDAIVRAVMGEETYLDMVVVTRS